MATIFRNNGAAQKEKTETLENMRQNIKSYEKVFHQFGDLLKNNESELIKSA